VSLEKKTQRGRIKTYNGTKNGNFIHKSRKPKTRRLTSTWTRKTQGSQPKQTMDQENQRESTHTNKASQKIKNNITETIIQH
jgi:hypothetical protein